MTDIWTLSPAELRGYAMAMDEAHGIATNPEHQIYLSRMSEIAQGFAARLEELEDGTGPLSDYAAREHVAEAIPEWARNLRILVDHVNETAERSLNAALRTAAPTPPEATQQDTFPLDAATATALEEMLPALATELTPAEAAQQGLADAVAESAAKPTEFNPAPGWLARDIARVTERAAQVVAEAAATPAPADAKSAHAARSRARPWTPERLSLLAQLYPTAIRLSDLRAKLNALPGDLLQTDDALRVKADKVGHSRQGLPIPPEHQGARLAGRQSAPAPAPAARIPLTTEDKHEIREKLRKGDYKGTRAIVEDYSCPDDEAQDLVDEHRARMGRAA